MEIIFSSIKCPISVVGTIEIIDSSCYSYFSQVIFLFSSFINCFYLIKKDALFSMLLRAKILRNKSKKDVLNIC